MSVNNEVCWSGYTFKGDAKKCYEEIQTLGASYTTKEIVDLARNENTELHKCFTWDDSKAAELWRLKEARTIVASLKVTVWKTETEKKTFRLIQHDAVEQSYKPVILTTRNETEYERLLNEAKEEMQSFKKRYESIIELEAVIDEIEKILNQ